MQASPPSTAAAGVPNASAAADIAARSAPEVLAALGVDADSGLTRAQVEERRKQHGFNEVPEQKPHRLLQFLRKFWGLSAFMLELIMLLSALLGKIADLVVVGALLIANALLGFYQEQRAAGVVETLRRSLRVGARVRRESQWQLVAARELVPGDIVRMRAGDIVPADLKLLGGELRVDESALTGESKDVHKATSDTVSSGSIVRHGEANAVVLFIGVHTYFGRTTELVQRARPKLHIEAVVAKLVRWLFAIILALLAAVSAAAWWRGTLGLEMAPLLLVLLMGAVPVALPVMFTVSMAVGSRELAQRGVLVTRLSAAEDAATMDVLCVDKTGTITQNQLSIRELIAFAPATELDLLQAGALASSDADQDPIDRAFLSAAGARGALAAAGQVAPISFAPFDAANRRTEAIVEARGQRLRVMKGAVRTLAELCGYTSQAIEALEARMHQAALKGYRALAVARGPEQGPNTLLGVALLYDAPRPDAAKLIATLRALGVSVKMLTGDALAVANEIAREVGLHEIRRVRELKSVDDRQGRELDTLLNEADGFAEVFPEDKYLVVERLQAAGHVTGMTGDGVNDAPALRQAEVGIAVNSATDVAKGAASVVLTTPGLTDIVTLIELGRAIYQRILTWIINKISYTMLASAFVATAFALTGEFVISAFAMLLLTFMTDFAKIALATDAVRSSRKPESWNIGGFIGVAIALGLAMVAEALSLLWFAWSHFGLAGRGHALYTFSFLTLLYFALFSIVSVRERRAFFATRPSRALSLALLGDLSLGTLLAQLGFAELAPLPYWQWLSVLAYAAIACLGVNDALKRALIAWWAPGSVATG